MYIKRSQNALTVSKGVNFNRDLSMWCVGNLATQPTWFKDGAEVTVHLPLGVTVAITLGLLVVKGVIAVTPDPLVVPAGVILYNSMVTHLHGLVVTTLPVLKVR